MRRRGGERGSAESCPLSGWWEGRGGATRTGLAGKRGDGRGSAEGCPVSGWWAGPGPARAGLAGRLTQGERGRGAVGGQRREHTKEQPPERGGLRGSKNDCQWSWPPPFVHPRAHRARLPALLASPPPDGRTWRGGRSRGWARRAASGSTQRWPRAEPGPRPPGRAGAAAASPWSSHWPLRDSAPQPPRVQSPRARGPCAQSPRMSRPRWACAQSPRKLGHASSSPNERRLRHWVLSVPPLAEALPVRRAPIGVGSSAGRLNLGSPDTFCPDPTNQLRTSGCSKRRQGNRRRLGGQRCWARTTPGAILGLLEPSRARPLRAPGPGRAHQAADAGAGTRAPGDVPRPISPAPRRRVLLLTGRRLSPSNLRLQTPARPLPVQSSLCLASPLYPLPRPHPTPTCLCPAPSAFFLPLKSGIRTATLESSLGNFRASLKFTRRPHNRSAGNLRGLA